MKVKEKRAPNKCSWCLENNLSALVDSPRGLVCEACSVEFNLQGPIVKSTPDTLCLKELHLTRDDLDIDRMAKAPWVRKATTDYWNEPRALVLLITLLAILAIFAPTLNRWLISLKP